MEKTTQGTAPETVEDPTSGTSKEAKNNDEVTVNQSTSTRKSEASSVEYELHYTVFCMLFMNGFLTHCRKDWDKNVVVTLAHYFVYIVTVQRSSKHTPATALLRQAVFLSFLVFGVYSTWEALPHTESHHNVVGFVSLVLLPQQVQRCRTLWKMISSKNHKPTAKDPTTAGKQASTVTQASVTPEPFLLGINSSIRGFSSQTLNVVRWIVVIMTFMMGFHKLNWDFLNPQVSCALHTLSAYMYPLGYGTTYKTDLPLGLSQYFPVIMLALELGAPLALALPSEQRSGIAVLLLIRMLFLPLGFVDMGTILMALLWLFLHPAVVTECGLPFSFFTDMAMAFCLFEGMAMIVWYSFGDADTYSPWEGPEATAVIFMYGMLWLHVVRNTHHLPGPQLYLPRSLAGIGAIVAFAGYTLSPYLGLRTVGVLSMFSNLRTEGTSNHLLLGNNDHALRRWSYQDDLIEIVDIDERMEGEVEAGDWMPLFVFQTNLLGGHGPSDLFVKVSYQGNEYQSNNGFADPEFQAIFAAYHEPTYWERKFLEFRQIEPFDEPQSCVW